ncbi:SH3 domain-containing protein [Leptospira wolffii]|uniref:SH3 domain-containing protein n=1 Tax=Leptospira wolffii TaxID=409998 RepID=UPI00034B10BD|nr:SH3 domain-containing protein [Leptospira wolffii]
MPLRFRRIAKESEDRLRYVTADVLNVRIRPDRQSEKLGFLPYGTKILAERAQTFEVQNNAKIYWFYIPDMDGYVFGDFLSDILPPEGKKKAILFLYSGNNCGYYKNETLTIQDGIARLEIDWEEEGGFCSKGLLEGIVSFRNGRMSTSQWKGNRLKDH